MKYLYPKLTLVCVVLFAAAIEATAQFNGALTACNDTLRTGPLQTVKKDVIRNDSLPSDNYTWTLLTPTVPYGTLTKNGNMLIFTPAANVRNVAFDVPYQLSNPYTTSNAVIHIIVGLYNNPVNIIDPTLNCVDNMPDSITFSVRRKYETVDAYNDGFSMPLVGDLNGDGKPEIIALGVTGGSGVVAAYGRYIKIYNGQDSTQILNFDLQTLTPSSNDYAEATQFQLRSSPYHNAPSNLAIADLDNDGIGEIVVCETGSNGRVYALKPTLNPTTKAITGLTKIWDANVGFKAPLTNLNYTTFGRPMPYIADLNGDGIPEVIVYNKVYNGKTGKLLMAWQGSASTSTPKASSSTSTDGLYEYRHAAPFTDNSYVSIIRSHAMVGRRLNNGNLADDYVPVISIVDIDGDSIQDIITGNRVYKIQINNTADEQYNTYTTIEGPASVTLPVSTSNSDTKTYYLGDGFTRVADIDGDGYLDVIVTTFVEGILNPTILVYVWDTRNPSVVKAAVTYWADGGDGNYGIPFVGDINGKADGWDGSAYTKKLPEICIISGSVYINRLSSDGGRSGIKFHSLSDASLRKGALSSGSGGGWDNNEASNTNRRFNRRINTSDYYGHVIALTYDASQTAVEERLRLSWAMEHHDGSDNTGMTLFDFNNDGAMDICYQDQHTIRVISPKKGNVDYVTEDDLPNTNASILFSADIYSYTAFEAPVIADVNMDGSADIVVVSAQSTVYSRGKIRVYEHASGSAMWAPCPPVWNQGMYDPLQVREDLKINARPQSMLMRYAKSPGDTIFPYNGQWIQQPIVTQGANYVPVVRKPDVNILNMTLVATQNYTVVTLTIRNDGSASINSQTPIAFYNGGVAGDAIGGGATLIGMQPVGVDIFPDETVIRSYTLNTDLRQQLVWARITDNGLTGGFIAPNYLECDPDNNVFSATDCTPTHTLSVSPDSVLCGPNDKATITVTIPSSSNPTYKWYRNDAPIDGATSSSYEATNTGDYKCFITNGPVCRGFTAVKTITDEQPTAVADYDTLTIGMAKDINVMDNDIYSSYCSPTPVIVAPAAAHGTATVLPSGEIRYTHTGATTGYDTITYTIGGTSTKVYLTIKPITPDTACILYVTVNGAGLMDGSSWANAYPGLADPLFAAQTLSCIKEIWVAEGTYYPTIMAGNGNVDRDKAFVLQRGVKIYGGFAGNETSCDARDYETHPTILSGDIDGDGTLSNYDAYHVVVGAGTLIYGTDTARLDGFTITGGNSNGASYITVNNISVHRNGGGGIVLYNGASPVLENLTVINNSTGSNGGGLNIVGSSGLVTAPVLNNVRITGNNATSGGGGIYISNYGQPTLTNVQITGNKAGSGGGIYISNTNARPMLTNVTLAGNYASNNGGGIYWLANTTTQQVRNSIIYGNTSGGSLQNVSYEDAVIYSHSLVGGATINAGIILNSNPMFVDMQQATSSVATSAGDYRLIACSPCIDKGDSSLNTEPFDLDGRNRIMGGAIDLGAYEDTVSRIPSTAGDITISDTTICADGSATLHPTAAGVGSPVYRWYSSQTEPAPFHEGPSYTTSSDSTFYISVEGVGHCENEPGDRQRVMVTVITVAPPAVAVSDPSCAGGALVFSAPFGYAAYEWRIDDETGNIVGTTPSISVSDVGSYTRVVRVQNEDGCWSDFTSPNVGIVAPLSAGTHVTRVTAFDADFDATPPTVTFSVSWEAGTRNCRHRDTVWVFVDYQPSGGGAWQRAPIGALPAHTLTAGGDVALEPGNDRGFWLYGNGSGGSYSATLTVAVTNADALPRFSWCAYASDYPPNAIAQPAGGGYSLHGTPPFLINSGSIREPSRTLAAGTCITDLTDSTGCPGFVVDAPAPTIARLSASTTTQQSVTQYLPIAAIEYEITNAGGLTVTGLSPRVEYDYQPGATAATLTISGRPMTSGSFPYTVAVAHPSGCAGASATGTLTVAAFPAPTGTWTCGAKTWSEPLRNPAGCEGAGTLSTNAQPPAQYKDIGSDIYGYYYNWTCVDTYAAALCPSPWRVPTKEDIESLIACAGGSPAAGGVLSAAWGPSSHVYGYQLLNLMNGFIWSSTASGAQAYQLSYTTNSIDVNLYGSYYGNPLRCVRDNQ